MKLGNDVLIRMRDGLDPKVFGSGWRIGRITAIGLDLLADEPVLELDDGGPRIYSAHIDFATVLDTATPTDVPPSIYRGR